MLVTALHSFIKGMFGQMASSIRTFQDIVIVNRKIEGQTKTCGVNRLQLLQGRLVCDFVCIK